MRRWEMEESVAIEAVRGDITRQEVDAIVNAANQGLAGGGGVDGAIHRAAGRAQLRAACEALGGCATGDAKATPGFNLAAQWIIHAVGPRWRGGGHGEAELLASCYRRSLVVAAELGARSIAFPAISTGIYGYPAAEAASVAVSTLRSTLASTPLGIELVRLVAFDDATFERYRELLAAPGPLSP
ncbi:MAG: O-acetyl-ADP-ribose deacetylase [Acidimicrobiaceae bacterium]|jgi:O-acetyl-ADP-ribose deacetylase (regulator of RNase III)|nr:O-acetyl-ADP-ribose deacetylase [Acidimicrobiaceae bacterium]MDQ1421498.1 O-acetyl-ADP-ribose deacetylase [Acidimicrobiaceae bacterium]